MKNIVLERSGGTMDVAFSPANNKFVTAVTASGQVIYESRSGASRRVRISDNLAFRVPSYRADCGWGIGRKAIEEALKTGMPIAPYNYGDEYVTSPYVFIREVSRTEYKVIMADEVTAIDYMSGGDLPACNRQITVDTAMLNCCNMLEMQEVAAEFICMTCSGINLSKLIADTVLRKDSYNCIYGNTMQVWYFNGDAFVQRGDTYEVTSSEGSSLDAVERTAKYLGALVHRDNDKLHVANFNLNRTPHDARKCYVESEVFCFDEQGKMVNQYCEFGKEVWLTSPLEDVREEWLAVVIEK